MSPAEAEYVDQSNDAKDTLFPVPITLAGGVGITISYDFFRGCRSKASATCSQQVDGRQERKELRRRKNLSSYLGATRAIRDTYH